MRVGPGFNATTQAPNVCAIDHFGVRQCHGHKTRNSYFVHAQVGIRRYYRSAAKVDALSRQIAAEPTVLSLQSLHKPTDRFFLPHGGWKTREFAVNVLRSLAAGEMAKGMSTLSRNAMSGE